MALAVPSVVFAFNAYISYRERGIVEVFDIPAAVAFAVAAFFTWRRSLPAILAGAALCAVYLATVIASGGPAIFIAYWIAALILIAQALTLLRRRTATAT